MCEDTYGSFAILLQKREKVGKTLLSHYVLFIYYRIEITISLL